MEKEKLIKLIENGFSQREISKELNTSQTNVRYWLKKHNLTTVKEDIYISEGKKFCLKCETVKDLDDFYKFSKEGKKGRVGTNSYCKSCSNKYHSKRVKNIKKKMIDYKGSECERCKLNVKDSHYSVFDFHHINPDDKDPNFRKIKYQKWEVIMNEIDKCQLLCSNCHRIVHSELDGW
jgi:predicted transcriptional regulator